MSNQQDIDTIALAEQNQDLIERYLANNGDGCLVCGGFTSVEATEPAMFESGKVFQEVECYECGAKWEEQYQLEKVSQIMSLGNIHE